MLFKSLFRERVEAAMGFIFYVLVEECLLQSHIQAQCEIQESYLLGGLQFR